MHLRVGVLRRFLCPRPFRSPVSTMLVPRSLSSWSLSLVLHRPHSVSRVASSCSVPMSFCVSFLGLPRPLVACCFPPTSTLSKPVAGLVTGLPLFFFSAPGTVTCSVASCGGSGTFHWAAVRLCALGIDASHSGCDFGRKAFNLCAAQ